MVKKILLLVQVLLCIGFVRVSGQESDQPKFVDIDIIAKFEDAFAKDPSLENLYSLCELASKIDVKADSIYLQYLSSHMLFWAVAQTEDPDLVATKQALDYVTKSLNDACNDFSDIEWFYSYTKLSTKLREAILIWEKSGKRKNSGMHGARSCAVHAPAIGSAAKKETEVNKADQSISDFGKVAFEKLEASREVGCVSVVGSIRSKADMIENVEEWKYQTCVWNLVEFWVHAHSGQSVELQHTRAAVSNPAATLLALENFENGKAKNEPVKSRSIFSNLTRDVLKAIEIIESKESGIRRTKKQDAKTTIGIDRNSQSIADYVVKPSREVLFFIIVVAIFVLGVGGFKLLRNLRFLL